MNLTLSLSNIWKSYGAAPVLAGVSFRFDSTGVSVLMGDNGAGKSTLLRICALLDRPDKGDVVYRAGGDVLSHDIRLRRRITLVLPKIGVFNASVFENAAYGLKIRGMERKSVVERTEKALEFAGLSDKRRQNAATLSSGETQRLGIARALVIDPEVLFLDEPAAFVDAANREIIEEIILRLKEEKKTAIILATHDARQAERLADRTLFLNNGSFSLLTKNP
jgi:tungstate transport system ATP-binding protein